MPQTSQYKTFSSLKTEEKQNIRPCMEIQDLKHRKKIITDNYIVCIDLNAEWCGPCKEISPAFSKLAEKYNFPGKCMLVKENIDLKLTNDYDIQGVPAFIFYRGGQLLKNQDNKTVDVVGGNLEEVEDIIKRLIAQGQ